MVFLEMIGRAESLHINVDRGGEKLYNSLVLGVIISLLSSITEAFRLALVEVGSRPIHPGGE